MTHPSHQDCHPPRWITWLALWLAGVVITRLPLGSSLWIDESMTWWAIQGSFDALVEKSLAHQGQPIPYCALLWLIVQFAGKSELVLRAPSLLAIAIAAWSVFGIARRVGGHLMGILAISLFICNPLVQVAAMSARPYALATASALVAFNLFLRWRDSLHLSSLLLSCLLLALSIHLHLFFGAAIFGYLALHLAIPRLSTEHVPRHHLVIGLATLVFLAAPALLPLLTWPDLGAVFTQARPASLSELLDAILPRAQIVMLCMAVGMSLISAPLTFAFKTLPWRVFILLSIVPPLLFFTYASATSSPFYARWVLWSVFSGSLLGALLVAAVRESSSRYRVSGALLLLLIAFEFFRTWHTEDWREAIATVNQSIAHEKGPVLVYSGLLETAIPDYFLTQERLAFLAGATSFYSIPVGTIPLPQNPFGHKETDFLEKALAQHPPSEPLYLVIFEHRIMSQGSSSRWSSDVFKEWLTQKGYVVSNMQEGGALQVLVARAEVDVP